MFDLLEKVVKYIIVTLVISIVTRIIMALLGIDEKLDGNETWDKYRIQEDKVIKKTGEVMSKVGQSVMDKTKQIHEQINQEKEKAKEVSNG